MKKVYCPDCKKFLFEATLAEVDIICRRCKNKATVRVYTEEYLFLKKGIDKHKQI